MKLLKKLSKWRNSSGFTLVEVIVSTALLGILIIGVLLFMTPVFSISSSTQTDAKADMVATTIETYMSKSLRTSLYIKVFTGADIFDINDSSGAIYNDAEFNEMLKFVDGQTNYELKCISIKYIEDTKPRNSSTGDTAYKYMLFNETYDLNHKKIDTAKTDYVFDESFYEDIYPLFSFAVEPVYFDKDGNVISDTSSSDETDEGTTESTPSAALTLYPVLEMSMNIYNEESMGNFSKVFGGISYIEPNNIKSLQLNSQGKYKIYQPMAVSDGSTNKDIYIFYISRKAGVAIGSSTTTTTVTTSDTTVS